MSKDSVAQYYAIAVLARGDVRTAIENTKHTAKVQLASERSTSSQSQCEHLHLVWCSDSSRAARQDHRALSRQPVRSVLFSICDDREAISLICERNAKQQNTETDEAEGPVPESELPNIVQECFHDR